MYILGFIKIRNFFSLKFIIKKTKVNRLEEHILYTYTRQRTYNKNIKRTHILIITQPNNKWAKYLNKNFQKNIY